MNAYEMILKNSHAGVRIIIVGEDMQSALNKAILIDDLPIYYNFDTKDVVTVIPYRPEQ